MPLTAEGARRPSLEQQISFSNRVPAAEAKGLLNDGWLSLKQSVIPPEQGNGRQIKWSMLLRDVVQEAREADLKWASNGSSPALACYLGRTHDYVLHPCLAALVRKRFSAPSVSVKERKPKPKPVKEKPINPDEVLRKVQSLLGIGDDQGSAIKAVLFEEEVADASLASLRSLLERHGFSEDAEDQQKPVISPQLRESAFRDGTSQEVISRLWRQDTSQTSPMSRSEEVLVGALLLVGRNISPEKQPKIWSRLEPKVTAAREWFILANAGLVGSVVNRYLAYSSSPSRPDLIQEGNLGLMKAIDKYDIRRGTRFSTYAWNWVRLQVMRALPETRGLIRPLRPSRRSFLEGEEEEFFVFEETIADTTAPSPERCLEKGELAAALSARLETLPAGEALVLREHFGLRDKGGPRALDETGRVFGVSGEAIRQTRDRGLNRLRHPSHARTLRDFLE